jgi:DNA-binding XRE family transcriptional regulator
MLVTLDPEKVKKAREEAALTKQDLAAAAGLNRKTAARIENGLSVRPKSARKVIAALGSTREGLGGRAARRH